MFGESESESPRVPSPWDSLISTPALALASSPLSQPALLANSTPPQITAIPKLVPEADDGNVEYKLQLLNPSAARFARLVTQLKWRLLEGGGQAYYELGVADSGALVGLPRSELEQTLETLEMMAGEIGASVIVVKEVEVPAALTSLAMLEDYNGSYRRREEFRVGSADSLNASSTTDTEAETEFDTDTGNDSEGRNTSSSSLGVFSMDIESESSESDLPAPVSFDIEIATVFKPRPFRIRSNHLSVDHSKKGKKKVKTLSSSDGDLSKGQKRRNARDRRREERRRALEVHAVEAVEDNQADELVAGLEALHVAVDPQPVVVHHHDETVEIQVEGDDDDVFATPVAASHSFAKKVQVLGAGDGGEPRLIVEALVVRKMSIEEAFLDFGGFALS